MSSSAHYINFLTSQFNLKFTLNYNYDSYEKFESIELTLCLFLNNLYLTI